MPLEVQGGDYEHVLGLCDESPARERFVYRHANLAALSRQVLGGADFDAAEYSLANHIMLHARGERRLQAIPVFPSRAFRNAALFVRRDSELTDVRALRGRRVGISEFAMTTAVWTRGHLQDRCGIDWRDVDWVTAAKPRFAMPAGYRCTETDQDLEQLLRDGRLDALMAGRPKDSLKPPAERRLRSLVADVAAVEAEYFATTRMYPIMHTVVLGARAMADPDAPRGLFDAYVRARQRAQVRRLGAGFLPGSERLWEQCAADGFESLRHGLSALHRRTIGELIRYLREQGLVAVEPAVDALFVPGSADWLDA